MSVPTKDSLLVPFSANFSTRITATPTVFGLIAAQATTLSGLNSTYSAAYTAAVSVGNRSKSLITAKNDAKAALLPYLRELYGLVQANLTVTNPNKDLLGVVVRSMPTPIGVPVVSPALDIVTVNGRLVRVRLHDAAGEGKRSKPAGVKGASVFSFVGEDAPTNPALYKYEGSTNQAIFDIQFPESVAPGATVWLTAQWYNERQQTGPGCAPVSTHVQFGAPLMAA